jgi:hypothetical protein
MGKDLHDVPKYRFASHLNHWLGSEFGFLAQAGSQSTTKNHDFEAILHGCSLPVRAQKPGSTFLRKVDATGAVEPALKVTTPLGESNLH